MTLSKEATFSFKGRDAGLSEALKTINKNVQNVSKATKDAAKSINRFNLALTALKAVANAVGKVISVAFNTIKKLVSAGLNTLKSLISGTFKFIKSALSTLLSWTVKALGKVFDGVKKLFNNILNFTKQVVTKTTELVKKGVKTIINSVQAYADKQYNEIQLKVSLGDSYEQVMKSFNKLLRYTTADKNDLLSVFATYAEVGKKPEEIEKYAKASIYMANATGQSLTRITRLLLGQEAAGSDLEKTIHRLGISISEQEQSISNIDKIIKQLEPEMKALANNSLNQTFANVKNDIIAIKEQIGQLFAGPVRYVAQSLDKLLTKLIGSNKITSLTDKLQKVFDDHIKPVVDKVFEFLEKFIMDPKGFFEALWKDIKQIGQNFLDNFASIMGSLGLVFGTLFNKLFNLFGNVNFSGIFSDLTDALNSFILNFGKGMNWWSDEEIERAEGKVSNLFINAWNDAHPNFTLSKDDKWYENLWKLLQGLWKDDIKPLLDKVIDWVKGTLAPILGEIFTWLGDVLSAAFTNFLLQSEVLRKIMSAIGMPIATRQDQENSYEIFKEWLPKDIVDGHAWRPFKSTDLTSEFLKSPYPGKDFTGTWGKYLELVSSVSGKVTGEALDILRRISRADTITENAKVPTVGDLITRIDNVLNPVTKAVTEVEDKLPHNYKNLYEDLHDDIRGKLIPELTEEEKATRELVRELKSHVTVLHVLPTSTGYGGGGIQDYFGQNEFKIKPYSNGGPVTHPTIALLGEDGDEYVLSNKMLKGLVKPNLPPLPGPSDGFAGGGRTTGGGGINVNPGFFLDKNGTWREDTPLNRMLDDLDILKPIADAVSTMGKDVNNISTWYENTETLPNPVEEPLIEAHLLDNTWIDKLGRKIIRGVDYFFSGDWVDDVKNGLLKGADSLGAFLDSITNKIESLTWRDIKNGIAKLGEGVYSLVKQLTIGSFKGVGILAQNGGFGTHIGNIYNNAFDENGSFSIMKAFSALIQELLPYLQKGLEIIGPLFDQAFEILGSAVQILGERLGQQLLPILEAFIPLMKLLADIIVALAPVAESILKPAITVIAAILQALVPILEFLMPAFAGIGAVIQTVSESINWIIAKLLNWLASIDILGWRPFSGLGYRDPGTVHGVGENYRAIMSQYEASRANTPTGVATTSVGTAGQTASYSGSNHIYITNEFGGAYIVGGTGAFRELAKIIKAELEDMDYRGQTI